MKYVVRIALLFSLLIFIILVAVVIIIVSFFRMNTLNKNIFISGADQLVVANNFEETFRDSFGEAKNIVFELSNPAKLNRRNLNLKKLEKIVEQNGERISDFEKSVHKSKDKEMKSFFEELQKVFNEYTYYIKKITYDSGAINQTKFLNDFDHLEDTIENSITMFSKYCITFMYKQRDNYDITFKILIYSVISIIIIAATFVIYIIYSISTYTLNNVRAVIKLLEKLRITNDWAMVIPKKHMRLKDEFGDIFRTIDVLMVSIRETLQSISKSTDELGESGIILASTVVETTSQIKNIKSNIDCVNSDIITEGQSIEQTVASVEEINKNIESLNSLIESQTAAVTESSAAIQEMVANNISVSQNVSDVINEYDELLKALEIVKKNQDEVNLLIENISEKSEKLMETNKLISNIANQTSLLSMNAAIEAAHAGDAGKGFSVVADEIRKMSDVSNTQSKSIAVDLKNIQDGIVSIVSGNEANAESIDIMAKKVSQINMLITEVSKAVEEQEVGSRQILEGLDQISNISFEVRSGSTEMKSGINLIVAEVDNLNSIKDRVENVIQEISTGSSQISIAVDQVSEVSLRTKDVISDVTDGIKKFKL